MQVQLEVFLEIVFTLNYFLKFSTIAFLESIKVPFNVFPLLPCFSFTPLFSFQGARVYWNVPSKLNNERKNEKV